MDCDSIWQWAILIMLEVYRMKRRDQEYILVTITWLGDHQGRPSALLIRCVKPSKYGALTDTLELELVTIRSQCALYASDWKGMKYIQSRAVDIMPN